MAARSGGLRSLRYPFGQPLAAAKRSADLACSLAGISGISGNAVVVSHWLARLLALAEPALITRDGHGGLVRPDIFISDT
jgi:hypothetical protein